MLIQSLSRRNLRKKYFLFGLPAHSAAIFPTLLMEPLVHYIAISESPLLHTEPLDFPVTPEGCR